MTEARITLPAGWLPSDVTPRDHQRALRGTRPLEECE